MVSYNLFLYFELKFKRILRKLQIINKKLLKILYKNYIAFLLPQNNIKVNYKKLYTMS